MQTGLVALFAGSLLASTIVPGGVEVLLYYMYQDGKFHPSSLLIVATAGNTIGGVITFAMGMLLRQGLSGFAWQKRIDRFFKLEDKALARVRQWGVPILFFSWVPVIGDPLVLAGGYLRLRLWPSIAMILFSKFARYAALLWLFSQPWAGPPQ